MSIEEFNKLKKNEGGLVVFNSYLSTSGDKNISMKYAISSLDNINMKAIFFVIHVDQTLTSNLVASLGENLSYFPHEQEYLWDMNSIFRIGKILEEENGVCQVNLTVTSDDDPQLRQLMEFMRKESGTLPGMQRLGNLMIEMGEWMKAKDIFETILQEEDDPCINQQLGFIAHQMNNLDEALRYYQHSLSIFLTNQSSDDPRLATLYSNIGCILKDQGNLKEADKQFQHVLKLEYSTNNPNKENIVSCPGDFTLNFLAIIHLKVLSFLFSRLRLKRIIILLLYSKNMAAAKKHLKV
jgi:tetratricopeptide (TPR) repeat protein